MILTTGVRAIDRFQLTAFRTGIDQGHHLEGLGRLLSLKHRFMKCIAVPVHFTSRSLNAARYAADLAGKLGAELRLLYVNTLPAGRALAPTVIEEVRHSGLESLKSLEEELRDRTGGKVPIHTDQKTGKKAECIRDFCKSAKPILIVTGGPIDIRLSCPVLNVPEGGFFHRLNTVVIACDRADILSGMADYLPFLTVLHNRLGCSFELVHVVQDGEGSITKVIQEYREWKTRPDFFPAKLHFIRQDEPQEGITEYLENHSADWLMVLPKNHGWIEFHDSHAKSISDSADIPVLSLYE